MTAQRIAPQVEFSSLEEFARDSNNFYAFFRGHGNWWGNIYRTKKPVFKRFQDAHPDLEKEVTDATTHVSENSPNFFSLEGGLPWEKLFEAYKLMSQLVFVDDPHVMQDGQPDKSYLIR